MTKKHGVSPLPLGTLLMFLFFFAFGTAFSPARAADTDKFYRATYTKFKPGKAKDALKIIYEHFQPVDRKVGRKAIPFDFVTGDWDHLVLFPFDTASMDTIPSRPIWWDAFVEQEGGAEEAQKQYQSYLDLVETSRTELAKLPAAYAP